MKAKIIDKIEIIVWIAIAAWWVLVPLAPELRPYRTTVCAIFHCDDPSYGYGK